MMKKFLILCMSFMSLAVFAETRELTIVNHQYEGTKQWIPGTIFAKKGDTVKLKLINNAPSGVHNFSIPAFKVNKNVMKGKVEEISFVADKDGIFEIKCGLHAAHVGGQLIIQ